MAGTPPEIKKIENLWAGSFWLAKTSLSLKFHINRMKIAQITAFSYLQAFSMIYHSGRHAPKNEKNENPTG